MWDGIVSNIYRWNTPGKKNAFGRYMKGWQNIDYYSLSVKGDGYVLILSSPLLCMVEIFHSKKFKTKQKFTKKWKKGKDCTGAACTIGELVVEIKPFTYWVLARFVSSMHLGFSTRIQNSGFWSPLTFPGSSRAREVGMAGPGWVQGQEEGCQRWR